MDDVLTIRLGQQRASIPEAIPERKHGLRAVALWPGFLLCNQGVAGSNTAGGTMKSMG